METPVARKPMAQRKSRRPPAAPKRKTAKPSRRRTRDKSGGGKLAAHGGHHLRELVGSLGRLTAQPLSALMTIAVIAIALALPAGLQLMVANGRALSGQWDGAIEIAVYLRQDVTEAAAIDLAGSLREDPAVADVELITAERALAEFRESSGFGAALDALTENPLPNLLLLKPAEGQDSAEAVASLSDRLRDELPADIVQADTEWVARFHAMLDVVRRVVALAGAMLALGVVLIVGNTIRLDIQNRRDEIEVAKLIGATDGFIRRPFLYSGFWYGLFGGLLALGLILLSLLASEEPVRRVAGLYGSGFRLEGPGLAGAGVIAGAGAILGWLGSWFSATRNMRRIEPGN